MPAGSESPTQRGVWRELLVPAGTLVVVAVLAHAGAARWEQWREALAALGSAAPLVYVALWAVLVPCGFPAAALGLTAGFLFGFAAGSAWAAGGLVLAGLLMYAVGQRWLRPRAERLASGRPRLAGLLAQAATGGLRLHVLARLSPLNYALMSYTLAAGGAPLRPYLAGLSGALPGLVAYVWLGAAAGAEPSGSEPVRRAVVLVGAVGLVLLVTILARRLARDATKPGDDGRA